MNRITTVYEQPDAAKEAGIEMTEDEAFEEVIADACQQMLLDTNAGQKLAEWGAQSQQNKGFLAKLKQIITDLLNRLRSYFKGVDPDSLAAKEFAKIDANAKETLAKMFVDMSIDAGEKLSTIKEAGLSIKNTATEGKISYALGKKYWYPQMTKAEIEEVKDIAQNEANKTDNYLGIDAKWLYNNEKGRRYFALYSTAREKITLLYACKDDRAEFEHDLLKEIIEEDGLNESIDTGSTTISKILSRVANANNRQAANRSGTVGAGSNTGDAKVHSRDKRKRSSEAFINCLRNISEVQSRYGLDDYYLFAVDRGDYATAQRMVDEASESAGFTTSGYHGSRTPGFTVVDKYSWLWLARDKFVANEYGTHTEVDNSGKPHDKKGVYAMRYNLGYNLVVYADGNSWGELPVTEDEYPGIYADEDTGDITTNAMAEWAERNGYDSITFVDVLDGGGSPTTVDVVFNPNRDAKSADPVTYDDDGNVIPLSERFNPANKDIRYKVPVEKNIDTNSKPSYDVSEDNDSHDPVYLQHRPGQEMQNIDHTAWQKKKTEAKSAYSLSEEEHDGVDGYVGGNAYALNAILRGDHNYERTEFADYWIQQTINGFSKFPQFAGRTYRNLSFTDQSSFDLFMMQHKEGMNVDIVFLHHPQKILTDM